MRITCPSCRSPGTVVIGTIPPVDLFAGRDLATPIPGATLCVCAQCALRFRHPPLPKARLDDLYRLGNDDAWTAGTSRRVDWALAASIVHCELGAHRILDVGCFEGEFLSSLGGSYERDGIEIHPVAAERARGRGIRIVADNLATLGELPGRYDVAVAMDVVEHVDDPRTFVRALAHAVRPGGLVLLSTGNAEARPWTVMKGDYWYCSMAEHISFLGPTWCRDFARAEGGLSLVRVEYFSHRWVSRTRAAAYVAANLMYRLSPGTSRALRRTANLLRGRPPRQIAAAPPPWFSPRDHFLAAFRVLPAAE